MVLSARSRTTFSLVLAGGMVALRIALFDWTFFQLRYVPNHDMYQAAPFFCTSMHSVSLTGDLAWWNPTSQNGYAQYYQALLSPLAPTLGHPVFIVWAQAVRLLALLGIRIPEYFQYLAVTYVVFPFLAIASFAWLCGLLFRHRSTVALAVIVFTLSSIGLWHAAWFYFQEPFTLFLLLGAVIAFLRRPDPRTAALLVAAALIQVASINYWSLYDSWFLLVVLAAYAAVHPLQVRRAGRRMLSLVSRRRRQVALIGAPALLVVGLWTAVVGSTVRDQASLYLREGQLNISRAQLAQVTRRPVSVPISLLFQPDIRAVAPKPYDTPRTMNAAGYLGAFLAPLLMVLPLYRWRRLEKWLFLSTAGVAVICAAHPLLLRAWEIVPFMDRIRHLFRFYPAFLRLMLLLLCGACFDRLRGALDGDRTLRRLSRPAVAVVAVLLVGGAGAIGLSGGWRGLLSTLVPGTFFVIALARPSATARRLCMCVLFAVAVADLARYFVDVNGIDSDFTATRWARVPRPLPAAVADALRRPWTLPDPADLGRLFDNMPIANDFWPRNTYMVHRFVGAIPPEVAGASFPLFEPAIAFRRRDEIDGARAPLDYQWRRRRYNDWSVEVNAPQDGWLSVAQLHDPAWRITVDGRAVEGTRANWVRTAFPVQGGRHRIEADYQPLARRAYWPASMALELTLLAVASWGRARTKRFQAPVD